MIPNMNEKCGDSNMTWGEAMMVIKDAITHVDDAHQGARVILDTFGMGGYDWHAQRIWEELPNDFNGIKQQMAMEWLLQRIKAGADIKAKEAV